MSGIKIEMGNHSFQVLPSSTYLFIVGVEVVYFHLITLRHTAVGRTPLDEGSARRRDLYLTTQTLIRSPSLFYLLTVGVEVVYFHLITLRHTPQSVALLWTRDRPVARTST
jgi:hypothetical protein